MAELPVGFSDPGIETSRRSALVLEAMKNAPGALRTRPPIRYRPTPSIAALDGTLPSPNAQGKAVPLAVSRSISCRTTDCGVGRAGTVRSVMAELFCGPGAVAVMAVAP